MSPFTWQGMTNAEHLRDCERLEHARISSCSVDPAFDTTEADLTERGVLLFEDHIQVEARHLKEDWQ